MGKHHEIEKKYIIAMPDAAMLASCEGCEIWEIEQIYLIAGPGETRRIRRVKENGVDRFYRTFKRRLSAMTAEEDEGLISREQYAAYKEEVNPQSNPILKTRYRVPYEGQVLEFDLYPFWQDRAVMEIELDSEDQAVFIPSWVRVLKDATGDYRYSNFSLSREIPMEEF